MLFPMIYGIGMSLLNSLAVITVSMVKAFDSIDNMIDNTLLQGYWKSIFFKYNSVINLINLVQVLCIRFCQCRKYWQYFWMSTTTYFNIILLNKSANLNYKHQARSNTLEHFSSIDWWESPTISLEN